MWLAFSVDAAHLKQVLNSPAAVMQSRSRLGGCIRRVEKFVSPGAFSMFSNMDIMLSVRLYLDIRTESHCIYAVRILLLAPIRRSPGFHYS